MKVAYIISRFPLLSETFILREMDEIERQGWTIVLFPLICQQPEITHAEVQKWMKRRNCIPYMNSNVFISLVKKFLKNPFRFAHVLSSIFFWNLPSPNFLIRALILFPKSILMADIIEKENIKHIHVHYGTHPALCAYIIHKFTGVSYSITLHSHDIYDNHTMLKQKLNAAKFLVTISLFNIDYLSRNLGDWVRNKTFMIHCGVNTKEYKSTETILKNYLQSYKILQIGSLHWKKGQSYLLRAIKILTSEIESVQVNIIGEGKERRKLEKLINELNLTDKVFLLGAKTQSEVKNFLSSADCYLQTSVSEGIPVALMEALACELPVISTEITGIPELVIHRTTGLLIPPKNEEAIAEAIKFLMANPSLAKNYGEAGRKHVEQHFDLQKNVCALINLFKIKIGE